MGTDRLLKTLLGAALALLLAAPATAREINYVETDEGNPELPASATPDTGDLELPLLPTEAAPETKPATEPEAQPAPEPEAQPAPEPEAQPDTTPPAEPEAAPATGSETVDVEITAPTDPEAEPAEAELPQAEAEAPVTEAAPAPPAENAPADPEAEMKLQKAESLLHSGDAAAAVDAFEELVNMNGVPAETYAPAVAGYASALRAAGRRDEAEHWYQEALTYNPDSADLRLAYAYTLAENEKLDRAIYQLDIIDKAHPGNSEVALARARAYAWNGDYDNALTAYNQVTDPQLENDALLGRAYVLYWSGDRANAEQLLACVTSTRANQCDVDQLRALLAHKDKASDDASLKVAHVEREDSEDNTYSGNGALLNIPLGPEGSRIFVSHDDFDLDNGAASASGTNTRVGFNAKIDDKTHVSGYAGKVSIDNTGGQTIDHTDMGLALAGQFNDDWTYHAAYSDNLLYDSPVLAAAGVSLKNTAVSTGFKVFDDDTTLELLYETGDFSDGNSRTGYGVDLHRAAAYDCRGELTYGARLRDLKYDDSTAHPYFSPDHYQLAEAYLDWLDKSDNDVKLDAHLGVGFQKVDDGDWQNVLRAALGVSWAVSDNFTLRAGVSHSDLPTDATQNSDGYSSREWYLNGEWVF